MADYKPVVIIGAGISGLTTAALLTRNGIPYVLYERRKESDFSEQGVTLGSWAWEPLLQELDPTMTSEQFRQLVAVDSDMGGTGRVAPILHDAFTGEVMNQAIPDHGREFFRAGRKKIRNWLLSHCDRANVQWHHEVTAKPTLDSRVMLSTKEGDLMKTDLLIGADGVDSKLRSNLLQRTPVASAWSPVKLDIRVFQGQRDMSYDEFETNFAPTMGDSGYITAVKGDASLTLSLTNANQHTAVMGWIYSGPQSVLTDRQAQLAYAKSRIISSVAEHCTGIVEPYASAVGPRITGLRNTDHWPMRRSRPSLAAVIEAMTTPDWKGSNVVLIGEAAHVMPSLFGLNASHALLDAVELVHCLMQDGRQPADCDDSTRFGAQTKLKIGVFYGQAMLRWQNAIDKAEEHVHDMHKSMAEWRDMMRDQ